MTCIVVITKGGKSVIASDSLTTVGEMRLLNTRNDDKLFTFKHFIIGVAGGNSVTEAIKYILKKRYTEKEKNWLTHNIKSRQDVANFVKAIVDLSDKRKIDLAGNDNLFELIIACPRGQVYYVASDRSIFEIDKFHAIGSADKLAIGSLNILYQDIDLIKKMEENGITISQFLSLERAAEEVIEIACKYDIFCQKPIVIRTI